MTYNYLNSSWRATCSLKMYIQSGVGKKTWTCNVRKPDSSLRLYAYAHNQLEIKSNSDTLNFLFAIDTCIVKSEFFSCSD